MNIKKWNVYSEIATIGETWTDPKDTPDNAIRLNEFIDLFKKYLPPPSRVLCPGGMLDALALANAGYEVYAFHPQSDSVKWLNDNRHKLTTQNLLSAIVCDGHDLVYPRNFFNGYFSVQVNEHWICPLIHIGEARYCLRDGAIVFVDACGTIKSNPDNNSIHHVNLVPEQIIKEQWNYWGFQEIWKGPLIGQLGETGGDNRPQFIFEALSFNDIKFKHRKELQHILEQRDLIKEI